MIGRAVLFLGILSGAIGAAGAGELGRVSLDQLAAIRTFLRAETDGAPGCPGGALTPETLAILPQLLESRIGARTRALTPSARKAFFTPKRIADCAGKCRCGIYADWIGDADPALVDARKALLAAEIRAPLTDKSVARCAAANRDWICENVFFRALVVEGTRNAKGNSP